jgi:hypothetical protein
MKMNRILKMYCDIFSNIGPDFCMGFLITIISLVSYNIKGSAFLPVYDYLIEIVVISIVLFFSANLIDMYIERKERINKMFIDDSESEYRRRDRSPIIFNVRKRI